MAKSFKIAKDAAGNLAYGLDMVGNRKYTVSFNAGITGFIPLTVNDKYAVFLASPGALFRIGPQATFAPIPVVSIPNTDIPFLVGTPPQLDSLGFSVLDLRPWQSAKFTQLHIMAINAFTLTIHLYDGVP